PNDRQARCDRRDRVRPRQGARRTRSTDRQVDQDALGRGSREPGEGVRGAGRGGLRVSESGADTIRTWIQRHRLSFELLEDPPSRTAPVTVLEKESGKALSFPFGAVSRLEEDRDPMRGGSYLRLLLEDGRNFALSGVGFVFEPSFASTGPLPDCPPVA